MNDLLKSKTLDKYSFLPGDAWDMFCSNTRYLNLKKGQHLLKEGATANTFYFIVNGSARFYEVTDEGNEVTYRFVFEHTFFTDYVSFFRQSPAEGNIVLLEDSELLGISHTAFENLACNFPCWQNFVKSLMVENTIQLIEKEKMLMTGDPATVYKKLFKMMPFLFHRIEQRYIASYMGITPETFSRIKSKLYEQKNYL
jgi:CRP-like cAMP-binding protein